MPSDFVRRMDSTGSGSEANGTDNILSSSPGASSLRSRTDSEGSDKITRFVLPSVDGSPPKVLTLDEVAHVVKNIDNMTLAHEIALNPEFKLQPYEPPEESLERRIKDIMHKAFWDLLREQLNSTPPCYDHAIQLLGDIKECFPQIISSNNHKILEKINEVLDETIIRQQAEMGVLDFRSYANFVIQIMSKLCAPARDEQIKKLMETEDVVETFRGILEVMTLMKLDMANFLLAFARNDILANSVEYEKEKFKEYLEYYKFGFPATENWLKRNQTQDASGVPSTADQTIYNAYMELMNWDESIHEFPEILSTDKDRILRLGQRALRLCTCASVMAICSGIPLIAQRAETRSSLAKQIQILVQNATSDGELDDLLENVFVQIKTVVNAALKELNQPEFSPTAEESVKAQVLQCSKKDSPIRNLMWKRLQTYFRLVLRSKNGVPPPPPGYGDYQEELEAYASALKIVIAYNHSVFGDYFHQVLTNEKPKPKEVVASTSGASSTTVTSTAMETSAGTSDEKKEI